MKACCKKCKYYWEDSKFKICHLGLKQTNNKYICWHFKERDKHGDAEEEKEES